MSLFSPATEADSKERWLGLCADARADAEAAPSVYRRLVQSYENPVRVYHNLDHVRDCLNVFDRWRGEGDHPVSVELALWFHDAVYDSRRSDNEARSASLARECLAELKLAGWVAQEVYDLILDTCHREPAGTADGRLIQDVDLAILAAPRETFETYDRAIRLEYDWVDETVYRQKRAEFLRSLRARPRLYLTTSAFAACEAPARENLERALTRLENGSNP